jgi:hypothetical protein
VKIAQSKGGRIQVDSSNTLSGRREAPLKPLQPRETTPIDQRRTQQEIAHERFKLALFRAGKGLGVEGMTVEECLKNEPLYDRKTNPTGVEMWEGFAIYRSSTKHRSGAGEAHKFGVAHVSSLTWKLWSNLPSERGIKQQKKENFNFPEGFYRRAGLSVGKHFQASPMQVDGKLEFVFKIEHIKSKRSKIIPWGDIALQGPFTYYFPKGFDKPGEETGEIWTQARWKVGEYSEGEELADVLGEFIHPYEEMTVIQGP